MKPRRILLLITTSDVGGTESFVANLAAGLDRRRFDPLVCSLCPPGRIAEQIAAAGTPVETLGMSPRARPLELISGVLQLARLIGHLEIDLVQALLYRANMMAALAARMAWRRVVIVGGQRSLTPMTGRRAALGVRLTRRFVEATVAVSLAVKEEIVRSEGIDPERIEVIANAIDGERFAPGDRQAARRSLELDGNALILGGVGRLTEAKGFEHLLAATASVDASYQVMLVGDGPCLEDLTAQAEELAISGRVHFLGRRSELETLYPALDVFVLSSLREGSPNVLLEAMACGLPVIATRVGGVPELIDDEVEGLLIPPGDADALAGALRRLAGDPDLRFRLGKAARQRVERDLTLERMVAKHEALYERLLAGSPQQG